MAKMMVAPKTTTMATRTLGPVLFNEKDVDEVGEELDRTAVCVVELALSVDVLELEEMRVDVEETPDELSSEFVEDAVVVVGSELLLAGVGVTSTMIEFVLVSCSVMVGGGAAVDVSVGVIAA